MLEETKEVFLDSPFQKAIYDKIENDTCHLAINAVAGSGKTTTIVKALKLVPINPKTQRRQPTIFLSFSKAIVKELETRCPQDVYVKTLHGWGWKEVKFRFGKFVQKDEAKISKIISKLIPSWNLPVGEDCESPETYGSRIEKLVDLMRFALPQSREEIMELCIKHEIELLNGEIDHAKEVLLISRADTKTFDYTDMIYSPATNKSYKCMKFKYVFVDECQDLNPMQHALVRKLIDPDGGRLIIVGDPRQSIYGFAGADIDSFQKMANLFPNTVELPLSYS